MNSTETTDYPPTCAACAEPAEHPISGGRHLCSPCIVRRELHGDLFPECPHAWHDVFDHSTTSRRLARPAEADLLAILRGRGAAEVDLEGLNQLRALELLGSLPSSAPTVVDRRWARGPLLVDRHRDRVEEVHLVGGRVARVRRTADGERYAEPWDEVAKRYGQHEPGLVARTSEATRLDPHRAAEQGRAWGHCMVCGRLLTAPESVTSGIGPVCVRSVYGYDARAEIVAGIEEREQRSRIAAVTS